MSAVLKPPSISAEDYLTHERSALSKSEFHDGQIIAMTGSSRKHNVIALNIAADLRSQLKKRPCETYINDMRVKALNANNYYYPDIAVVCGTPQFAEDAYMDTLLNPSVIIEVLSPSTEAYDRGEKFARYRKIDSLQAYVLVAQDQVMIERYERLGDVWQLTETVDLNGSVNLACIGCTLSLAEIYDKVFDGEDRGA